MISGYKTSAETTKHSAQLIGKSWKAGLCLADPQTTFPNTRVHKLCYSHLGLHHAQTHALYILASHDLQGLPVLTVWMKLRVLNFAWKFFEGLTFASQTEAPLLTKICLQIRYCYRVCFCTAFYPQASLKSHWPWYLQKGSHHCFLSTPAGSNPLIPVLVWSCATQLGNDTPTYRTSRVQDPSLLVETCKEMWEVCYLFSCAIMMFQVLRMEERWTCWLGHLTEMQLPAIQAFCYRWPQEFQVGQIISHTRLPHLF